MDPLHTLQKTYKHWAYKNTTFLIISLALFIYFADSPAVDRVISYMGNLGYVGAVFAGIFFVSTFTVAPASVVLFHLATVLSPIEVALLAGLGAVFGDYLAFRFLQNKLFDELNPLFNRLGGSYMKKLFRTPYFAWMLPLVGALIIASPLPDEAGVSILSVSKLKQWQFLALTFVLNAVGILIIVLLAQAQ